MREPNYPAFIRALRALLDSRRIYTDFTRRFAYGVDASCYRYVPRVVVRAVSESEIILLLDLAQKFHTPLTFRAAGTSLSGQACSDSVLVLANALWQGIEVRVDESGQARSIFCDCGVIGSEANAALKAYGKKIGPDPATINNAMIGGIFSNNSSGMCCGVKQNSYQTIRSVRVILHDGFVLDTSERAAPSENIESYLRTHAAQAEALLALREEILNDRELCALIARKFAIKNTTGYGINSLLDFANIKDILNHIFIGAEGSLGFISRVEYECVEDYAYKACALLFYENLNAGAKAVQVLAGLDAQSAREGGGLESSAGDSSAREGADSKARDTQMADSQALDSRAFQVGAQDSTTGDSKEIQTQGFQAEHTESSSFSTARNPHAPSLVSAAEIMDYACLQSAAGLPGAPSELHSLPQGACALLIQVESNTQAELDLKIATLKSALDSAPSLFGTHFSSDEAQMAQWWKIRKALLPLAAGKRESGSVVITEDVCFEIESFARGIEGITELFSAYGYEGIIFGHALSGNVHFIITPLLDSEESRARFGAFMEALVARVVELGGSSKAEHGTGRMIAPFVEQEWGARAYKIHRRIKEIFDPLGVINPDVIITDNPRLHLENLKSSHAVEEFINGCMECGFCEKVCPSRELSLTPRQRIALRREITRLEELESRGEISGAQRRELGELRRDYPYLGVETCATCSMCASSCPLEIDTAQVALRLKPEMVARSLLGGVKGFIAEKSAAHFGASLNLARVGLSAAQVGLKWLGRERVRRISRGARFLPYMPASLPSANHCPLNSSLSRGNSSLGNHSHNPSTPASLRRMSNTPQSQGEAIVQSNTANTRIVCGEIQDSKKISESTSPVIASNAKQSTESITHTSLESKTDSKTPSGGVYLHRDKNKNARSADLEASSGWGIVKGEGATSQFKPLPLNKKEKKNLSTNGILEVKNKDSQAKDSESETQTESIRALDSEKLESAKALVSKKRDLESKSVDCHAGLTPSRNDNKTEATIVALYFSTCINRAFAPAPHLPDTRPLQAVFASLCHKAGISVCYPKGLQNLCCGKAFKDYPKHSASKLAEVRAALESSLEELRALGLEPRIVCDHSACSYELKQGLEGFKIYDMPEFVESTLLPRLRITPLPENIALYAMCATRKGKWDSTLRAIARACVSGAVIEHEKTLCCGFAGNKGFTCPELNASALRELSEYYGALACGAGRGDSKGDFRGDFQSCESHAPRARNLSAQHLGGNGKDNLGALDFQSSKQSPLTPQNPQSPQNLQNLASPLAPHNPLNPPLRYGFASSSTCEIGLNDKTTLSWQNILYLVDRVSASKE